MTLVQVLNDPLLRNVYFEHNLYAFGVYYFGEMMTHKSPEWHKDFCKELMDFRTLLLIGHRDSAKTSWAKIKIIHNIVYKKCRFIPIISAEKNRAEKHCFDIAVQLQANKLLVEDYGQLYFSQTKEQFSKKKAIGNFITENGVQVIAYSTDISLRGEQYIDKDQNVFRPDFIWLDDIETDKTKFSIAMTEKIKRFVDDLDDVSGVDTQVLFCSNMISNNGVISHILARQDDKMKVIQKALIENDEITWPSKFVWTNKEADEINSKQPNSKKWVKSIEQLKSRGTSKFKQEYLNIPISEEDEFVKKEWIINNTYLDVDENKLKIFISLDPQGGETKQADEFVITVLGTAEEHKYILKQIAGRKSALEQAGLFVEQVQSYGLRVKTASIEVVLNQTAVYQLIRDWQAGRIELPHADNSNRNIAVNKYKPDGKKGDRLMRQEDKFERGEIHLRPEMTELMEQIVYFNDKMPHDDRVDSFLQACEISNLYGDNHNTLIVPDIYNDSEDEGWYNDLDTNIL